MEYADKRNHLKSAATLMLALLTGCATTVTTTTPGGERVVRTKEEFGAYVEQVFRFRNKVESDLIAQFELDAVAEGPAAGKLQIAEDRLTESCRYLDETVMAEIEGRDPGMHAKRKMVETIASCDGAAHEMEQMIQDVSGSPPMPSTPKLSVSGS